MSVPICPDCRQDYGPEAHVCAVSGGTRCPKCYDLCPDNEVMDNVCIDCYECPDCRKRVASLWALVADEEMPVDELPAEWEQRCARHATPVDPAVTS